MGFVTSTTTVMKEMKDQMVALAAKVEEFQHNQTLTNRGPESEEDNIMGPGNSVALTESTQAVLDNVGQRRPQKVG